MLNVIVSATKTSKALMNPIVTGLPSNNVPKIGKNLYAKSVKYAQKENVCFRNTSSFTTIQNSNVTINASKQINALSIDGK